MRWAARLRRPAMPPTSGFTALEFTAMAPSGAALRGDFQLAAKSGNLPAGNGLYGPGDVCLFAAEATALNG